MHCVRRAFLLRRCRPLARRCLSSGASSNVKVDDATLQEYTTKYFHNRVASFTSTLSPVNPAELPTIPIYRVIDVNGRLVEGATMPDVDRATCVKMYKDMTLLNTMDRVLYDAQRQGRISFYMTNFGEEASHIGSASALNDDDLIYSQYREAGVLMWRGFTLDQFINSCYGNKHCTTGGRQMPVHYGSKELHFVTISSPLSTQMPQAVGAAYAYKRAKNGRCVVCYFGEGAASEGDAHAALNFASTLDVPLILFCRNNGYAISTPTSEQYGGDAIAGKGVAYGLHTIRVDGNDVFAVRDATKRAREIAMDNKCVLIEAMTYRLGHHSTSDDSSAYRPAEEVAYWDSSDEPIKRLRLFMIEQGHWSEEEEKTWLTEARQSVLSSFADAEKTKRAPIASMFEDVYESKPPRLTKQLQEMQANVAKHPDVYPLQDYESS